MEKPIAFRFEIKGLRCDAPNCGYHQDHPTEQNIEVWEKWLHAPCPKCGEPLLTQADLDTMRVLMETKEAVNKLLEPMMAKLTEEEEITAVFDLGMDGSGAINPKLKEIK